MSKNTYNFTPCMLCFPNCKINIGLFVTGKRADGYHNLETIFYPVPYTDVLEIVPAEETQLHLSGLAVAGATADNLVLRAYQLLHSLFPDAVKPLGIYLHKVVPMGAGLGGGSADAAFMLTLMNDYCSLGLSSTELEGLALQLGSDCPFFITNKPMFATGRGEVFTPVDLSLNAYSLQLICPAIHVSTRDAFAQLIPTPAPFSLANLPAQPIEDWRQLISNDFETTVFAKHPQLASIKQQLYDQGALYAAMSGSGSAIYGIFPKGQKGTIAIDVAVTEFYVEHLS